MVTKRTHKATDSRFCVPDLGNSHPRDVVAVFGTATHALGHFQDLSLAERHGWCRKNEGAKKSAKL